MKTAGEHLQSTIAMIPGAVSAVAHVAWLSFPTFWNALSSQNFAQSFDPTPWHHLTMPHDEFTTAIIMGDINNSPLHPSYFP